MKRVLVAGINGFVGRHMARELLSQGCEIYGIGHDPKLAEELPQTIFYQGCDLTSPEAVSRLSLDALDAVINLAGIAINSPNPDEEEAKRVIDTNVLTHTVLCDRLVERGSAARVVVASTGAVCDPDSAMPLTEESELVPIERASPYIKSKLLLEQTLKQYSDSLDILVARPFNHTGPGQRPGFLVPDWAERILAGEELDASKLTSWRDFIDVRDVVKVYALMALCDRQNLNHRLYNISSGVPRLIYDIVRLVAMEFGRDLPPPRVEGPSKIYASHDRLTSDTDWEQEIPISQTIKDYAAWKLEQVA